MTPAAQRLGSAVRRLRGLREMGQNDLAAAAGIDKSYLSLIECGHRDPSAEIRAAIAAALGVSEWLMVLIASPDDLRALPPAVADRIGGMLLRMLARIDGPPPASGG